MAQIIKIKGSKTNASAIPSSLVERELASNLVDRCLFGSDGTSVFKYYTGTTKYFDANGYANNANKLGGQSIDYFASADGVSTALEEIIDSLKGYHPLITSSNKLAASLVSGLASVATSGMYSDLLGLPTTISGYGITDAYTITQIDSIVNGLSGNISTLQGYFTDGVANSALRLSDNGSYTAWGQTFFANGKPKSVSGALTDVTDITSSGTITTNKIVIGNGTIEWDETNKGFKVTGLYSTTYLSAKGANTNGGSTPSGNQYTRLDTWDGYTSAMDDWVLSAKLGKGLYDTQNSLISRVGALEGKATNVSFTQSLTSGTQIGSISIDGVAKNIYAPTIPTNLSQFTDDVVSGKYLPLSGGTLTGLLTIDNPSNASYIQHKVKGAVKAELGYHINYGAFIKNETSNKFLYVTDSGNALFDGKTIYHSGNTSTIKSDLGLGSFAYKNSLAFADLTNKPTTISGFGITDAYTKSQVDSALGGYLPLSGGIVDGTIELRAALSTVDSWLYFSDKSSSERYAIGIRRPTSSYGLQYYKNGDYYYILHSGNYTDYTYSKSTIDTKLSGYLPLSGGTIDGNLSIGKTNNTTYKYIQIHRNNKVLEITNTGDYGVLNLSGASFSFNSNGAYWNSNTLIHSGNIGSQSVASATKLETARTIWGQSFDGTADVDGNITISNGNSINIGTGTYSISRIYSAESQFYIEARKKTDSSTGANVPIYIGWRGGNYPFAIAASGNVGIGTTSPTALLHLEKNGAYDVDLKLANTADNFRLVQHKSGDAYISLNGNHSLIFETGNTECMRITSSGHILANGQLWVKSYLNINRNGSTGEIYNTSKMGVEIESYADYFAIRGYKSGSSVSASINIASSGNVGIGTTEPYCTLEVNSSHKDINATNIASSALFAVNRHKDDGLFVGHDYTLKASWLQSAYYGTTANPSNTHTYKLLLNPLGGNVGIGTTSPQYKLDVNGVIHSNTGIFSDGYVSAKGQNTSSDMRLKNVLNEVVLSVKDIANAPSMRFAWKNGGGVDVGSSAQYWQGLLPDAVKEYNSLLEMQYGNIALLSAIAIAKNVETHEERIARLERENEELRNEINSLRYGA